MIEEIAKHLSLTTWDWIAVLIAILSLFIACCSFIIAKKTLKSQKQTEINTLPIINKNIQEFLFGELITKLLDGHMRLTALWYLLNEHEYKCYSSERFLRSITIPTDIIHVELFYSNYNYYRTIQGLVDMINDYNMGIDVLGVHVKDVKIDNKMLYKEFEHLLQVNDKIAETWGKVMTILFKYDSKMKSNIFKPYIEEITEILLDENDRKRIFYKEKEIYSDYFELKEEKEKMLAFMEKNTSIYYNEFSKYLIKR